MFDEALAVRIREVLQDRMDVTEQKMFGGVAFMVRRHMCVGIVGSDLMVRVGADGLERALAEPHARPMDFTGRPSRGMVYVAKGGVRTKEALRGWIARGLRFTQTLPDKK